MAVPGPELDEEPQWTRSGPRQQVLIVGVALAVIAVLALITAAIVAVASS